MSAGSTRLLSRKMNRVACPSIDSPMFPLRVRSYYSLLQGTASPATLCLRAKKLGYSDSDIDKGKSYVKFIRGGLPFYAKAVPSVKNNQVSLPIQNLQVGRVNIPDSLVKTINFAVEDSIERRINQISGLTIESAQVEKANFHLKAISPNMAK